MPEQNETVSACAIITFILFSLIFIVSCAAV